MERTTLGSYLRRGREEAGLTLEFVAQQTKIPRRTLEALESGRTGELPALIFVRGFVRAYCGTVGIDSLRALEMLENPQTRAGELSAGQMPGAPHDGRSLAESRQPIYLSRPQSDAHRGLRISHFILVLIAVALFVAAYVIAGSGSGERGPSAAASGQPATPGVHPTVPGPQPPGDGGPAPGHR